MVEASVPDDGRCDKCGFSWALEGTDAVEFVGGAAARLLPLFEGRDGSAAPEPGVWSPVGYVAHLADVLRVSAERVWTARHDLSADLVPYDQDDLARVRGYDALAQAGTLWGLERAVGDWTAALEGAELATPWRHPEFAAGTTLADASRHLAHEVHHHEIDVRRGLGLTGHPPR